MRYQWGRKDPFTFATNSEQWGVEDANIGKYPVKLYNSNNVLIYQEDNGGDNSGMKPSGGILSSSINASSMNVTIANPITFYLSTLINQDGQSRDLYDYYCTSYSRGTDGMNNNPSWHNDYLDSYIPSRHKSIYDPCPYGYRIPSNGTYNEFKNKGWIVGSSVGGVNINDTSWITGIGIRTAGSLGLNTGVGYILSNSYRAETMYMCWFWSKYSGIATNYSFSKVNGWALRCIEDCSVVSDATEASAGY